MLAALGVFGGYRAPSFAKLSCSVVLLLISFGFFAPGAEKLAHIDDGLEFEYPIFTAIAYWASVGTFVFVSESARRVGAWAKSDLVSIANEGDPLPPPPPGPTL
jgi:divalent metal cation (Fe/Co/Zn/Cd) transporter